MLLLLLLLMSCVEVSQSKSRLVARRDLLHLIRTHRAEDPDLRHARESQFKRSERENKLHLLQQVYHWSLISCWWPAVKSLSRLCFKLSRNVVVDNDMKHPHPRIRSMCVLIKCEVWSA